MPFVLTLVADRTATALDDATVARVREAVAGSDVHPLSPGEATDIVCSTHPDMRLVREAVAGQAIDAIAQPADGRRKSLLLADMDSTIVDGETLDELADFAGLRGPIAAITARAMNGELDFREALRERVAMLKGLQVEALDKTWERIRFTRGARELVATMRAHGAVTALVSGGFTYFTSRVAHELGFDIHLANTLLDDGAALTGGVGEPILDRDAKVSTLRDLADHRGIPLEQTLAVGDGANDLEMLAVAGLGVAFRPKPVVAARVRACIAHADLRSLLFAQGYRRDEIEEGAEPGPVL